MNIYEKIVGEINPHLVCGDMAITPSEKILQAIWFNQRIKRGELKTTKNINVRVLHPGFFNLEAGPDFKNAIIQFDNQKPVQGDIEIDLNISDWKGHSHSSNPNYNNVILHIVWDCPDEAENSISVLPLRPFLESPLAILEDTVGIDFQFPPTLEGVCSKFFKRSDKQRMFLEQAALFRLEQKSIQMSARSSSREQVLWEGLFRALGYKNNSWAFQSIGELKPLILGESPAQDERNIEARLFGLSGLLPYDLSRSHPENDGHLKRLWDYWWREREIFSNYILPGSIWRLSGTRPVNHPHRRIALAARWLFKNDLSSRFLTWLKSPGENIEESFLQLITPEEDPFWNWHYTIKSAKTATFQPLIGIDRATDIAINIVLPWLLAVSRENSDTAGEERVKELYLRWKPAQDNALLKLARKRILGAFSTDATPTAATQQGLIQIVKNFCENSDSICTGCKFPDKIEYILCP